MSPLSNNIPDPAFPPIPPLMPAPTQTGVGGGTFSNLGGSQPLVEQPILLDAEDHMATVAQGGDALVEIPEDPGAQLADTTITEKPSGAEKS